MGRGGSALAVTARSVAAHSTGPAWYGARKVGAREAGRDAATSCALVKRAGDSLLRDSEPVVRGRTPDAEHDAEQLDQGTRCRYPSTHPAANGITKVIPTRARNRRRFWTNTRLHGRLRL
jgi:hypothetical protein